VSDQVVLTEPARSYVSSVLLALLLLAGLLVDLATGGARSHAFAWVGALVIVVGADAFTVRAARALRSITLTTDELRVGPAVLARAEIAGMTPEVEVTAPVLGRTLAEGMPRGATGLTLLLADSSMITVPVRRPEPFVRALGLKAPLPEIRTAEPAEYGQVGEVERASDQLFAVSGFAPMPEVDTPEELAQAAVVLVAGRPVIGSARIDIVDSTAHLQELAVVPRAMRQGIGTALVEAACDWAKDNSFTSLTLTTFADVAWNGPFYAKLGFVRVDELTPGLAALREHERAVGLDAMGKRIAMRRQL
jgi:GNAT superfamily N-acetyltransferase